MKQMPLYKKILFSAFTITLLLILTEKISQIYEQKLPPLTIDTSGGFNETSRAFHEDKNGFMILNPNKSFIFNAQTFLKDKPSNVLRIALLGESSINNLYSLQELLTQKIRRKLKTNKQIEVLNFGANAYGSTRLAIVAKELASYKPELVFIYIGNNEFEELEQLDLISPGRALIADTIYRSSFARLISRLALSISISNLKKEREERFFSSFPNVYPAKYHRFTEIEINTRMNKFQKNLELIVKTLKESNAKILMSSIPSNYMAPFLRQESIKDFFPFIDLYSKHEFKKAFELSKKILSETPGRHQATDAENTIIKNVANKHKVPFFDFEKLIIEKEPNHIPGETLFYDHCHLNLQGNYYFIEELAKNISGSLF